ncbi:MAG: hypothetical protein B6D55_01105 [Candidatus Omnitrophica bacterium 4484_70.2]|nr:MAG: hypothetical protein B6D55_01105 [Candidatus Omnitrophica bacterium 4484_70.2]
MGENILLIEDEEIVVKSIAKLLKKNGYKVTIAHRGIEALEAVKKERYNLLICDVRMPGMDGIDTIKEIRKYLQAEGKSLIPEVVITGYADEDKYKEAVKLKVADYLYKPFNINDFLEVVKRNLK